MWFVTAYGDFARSSYQRTESLGVYPTDARNVILCSYKLCSYKLHSYEL